MPSEQEYAQQILHRAGDSEVDVLIALDDDEAAGGNGSTRRFHRAVAFARALSTCGGADAARWRSAAVVFGTTRAFATGAGDAGGADAN